ncbi:MAG TPA: xanthine dehydrogenase family protein molybdopterin-binding subunit [Stellaceae bacterium]|nr:xanthine dehydrogenase family protein molybdopterin-binding subunit [Stellaceae bacterium]
MDGGTSPFRAPVTALDGPDKVTGTAVYTFDISLPGMLHAKVLRSPHPHARIRAIDTSRAAALPGVAAVVTGADAAALPDPYYGVAIRDQPVIALDKVRYVGDMVAAVAAIDEATAYRALMLIDVDYELLPAVTTIDDALADGAPILFDKPVGGAPTRVGDASVSLKEPRANVLYEFGYANGDAAAVLAASDHVFEDRFVFSRINHFHLEPHVNIARVTRDQIELWSCNQDPFVLRGDIARIFGRPANAIRIHTAFVGGGFGGKSFCKMEPLVVLLAMKAGRPVRLCLSMDESLLTLTKHAALLVLKTGVMADGRLTARQSEIYLDAGAYSDASVTTTIKTGYRITGPYRWDAVASRAYAVRTTMVPAGSFRGFGGTQASFASESQIDMIARRLGIDPYAFRRKNLLSRAEPFQPGDSPIDSDVPAVLEDVASRIGYFRRPALPAGVKRRGWGLAIGLKDGGGTGNHSLALVKVLTTGRVIVNAATVEIGQGATTALCRIAAEMLGLPLDWVRYGDIDTDHTPLNNGTHVSCATAVTGLAVERAAEDARRQILDFAAQRLGCAAAELVQEGWSVRRGNYAHPIEPLIRDYFGGAGTEFIGRGSVKIDFDPRAPMASPAMFWIPCWVGAEVEVDTETGKVEVTRLVAAADSGTSINALACRGQVEGAVLQAYGQSLFEELRFDGANPVNATPLSYRVPLASDLPTHFEGFVVEHGGPGPFGAKGIGEAGMLGVAAAIANAIDDAVGVRLTQIPFTPERVLTALDAKK